jgi:hypothetical protein
MSQGFGHAAWIGFGIESTYGTAVARTKFFEFDSESLDFKMGFTPKSSVRGADNSYNRAVKTKKEVSGTVDFAVSYSNMEVLFKHALGTNNTTGAGPYTHAITLAAALPTGLSIEVNRDAANLGAGSSWLYEGCQIDSMTLSHEPEGFLMASFELVGEDSSNTTISTPTFATFDGISWDELVVTLNGVTIDVSSYELKLSNNLAKDRFKLGSRVRKGLGRSGPREVTGTLKMEYDAKTISDYFRVNSETLIGALIFTYTSGTKSLVINVPYALFTGKDPAVDNAGPIPIELSFRGYGIVTDNSSLFMTFVNSVTTVP